MDNDFEITDTVSFGGEEYPTYNYHNIFESGPPKCDTDVKTNQLYYKPSCSGFNFKPQDNPYLPIENEPMGAQYSPDNFNGYCNYSRYKYNPLTYKTPSRSYFDTWMPFKNEHFTNFSSNSYLVIFLFIILIIVAYFQNKQINNLQNTIITILKK